MRLVDRRRFLRTTGAAAGGVVLAAGVARRLAEEAAPPVEQPVTASPPGLPEGPYRAFSDRSEWNRPLPPDAPVDARSDAFVQELLRFDPGTHSIRLAMGIWAEPIYWAGAGDPEVRVEPLPNPVRIPEHATPAPSRDAQLTVYDVERGIVTKLHHASRGSGGWEAQHASIYYLDSNGLEGSVPGSDERGNRGHRGFPPPLHAVRWDEIEAGEIRHVLKVAIRRTASWHVYPGAGDEGGDGLIPEGAVLRIRPDVDLSRRHLSPAARVIASAIQTYGVVIGDQGGVPMALKVENLHAEGARARWSQVRIFRGSLAAISFRDLECIELGYRRP
jgi:hypothetical protein